MEEGPCEICGVVGFEEILATCFICGSREHGYCMTEVNLQIPKNWICEQCTEGKDMASASLSCREKKASVDVENHTNTPKKQHHCGKWQKKAKVKFLPTAEVIKLSSGAPKIVSPVDKTVPGKHEELKMGFPRKKTVSWKPELSKVVERNHPDRLKPNPTTTLPSPAKPATHGSPSPNEELKMGFPRKKTVSWKPELSKVVERNHPDRLKPNPTTTLPSPAKPATHGSPSPKLPISHISGQKLCNAVGSKNRHGTSSHPYHVSGRVSRKFEERDLDVQPKPRLYQSYLPAFHATWKGIFKISHSNSSPGKLYGGFQAQPPCSVLKKAYEFSFKLPSVLPVDLVSRSSFWEQMFQDLRPDLCDIGLYFLPQRSHEKNVTLYELMEKNDAMLTSCVDGVDLRIFTSTQLNSDSQDMTAKYGTRNFLWGLFQPREACQAIQTNDTDKNEVVDMDIDLIGGQEIIGRVDNVISKRIKGI